MASEQHVKFRVRFQSLWKSHWYFRKYSTKEMGVFFGFLIDPFSLKVTQGQVILVLLNFKFIFERGIVVRKKSTGCPVSGG